MFVFLFSFVGFFSKNKKPSPGILFVFCLNLFLHILFFLSFLQQPIAHVNSNFDGIRSGKI